MRVVSGGKHFYRRFVFHPASLLFAFAFVAVKVWSNLSCGGSLFIGLRSGVMGLVIYGLAFGVIDMLSGDSQRGPKPGVKMGQLESEKIDVAMVGVGIIYLLIAGRIIDLLQRGSFFPGEPLLSFIPGWENVYHWLQGLPGGYMVSNILSGFPLYVLAPVLLLYYLGSRGNDFRLWGGDIKPAIPFLVIYVVAFITTGVTLDRLVFLGYAILYTGLQEEFFFRGVMQPLFITRLGSPGWGMGLSVFLFAALHIPDFVFRVYPTVPLALSSVFNVGMFGAFMAYGVYRTGMLWPWILIHAMSNVVG